MRIGIIGGLERTEADYARIAAHFGYEVEVHSGHTSGGAGSLAHVADRCEIVVIVTEVNSHGAVLFVRQRMRSRGRTPLLVRRLGIARFTQLLTSLSVRSSTGTAGVAV